MIPTIGPILSYPAVFSLKDIHHYISLSVSLSLLHLASRPLALEPICLRIMGYDAPNIEIADVELVEVIKQTDRAFLCGARWQDKDCMLKVVSEEVTQHACDS